MSIGYEEQRERIVESFEHNKLELQAAVQDLSSSVRHKVDVMKDRVNVRNQIGYHPMPWLASSFALGLLLGTRKWLGRTIRRAGF